MGCIETIETVGRLNLILFMVLMEVGSSAGEKVLIFPRLNLTSISARRIVHISSRAHVFVVSNVFARVENFPAFMHDHQLMHLIQNIKTIKNVNKQLFFGRSVYCEGEEEVQRLKKNSLLQFLSLFPPSFFSDQIFGFCWVKDPQISSLHSSSFIHFLLLPLISQKYRVNSFHSRNCSPLFEIQWGKS